MTQDLFYPNASAPRCSCSHEIKRHNVRKRISETPCLVRGCDCEQFSRPRPDVSAVMKEKLYASF